MAKATVSLGGRDILDLDSLSVEEYELILKTAAEMKRIMKRDIKKVPSLRGKSIINLFYEPSTTSTCSMNQVREPALLLNWQENILALML